MPDLVKYAGGVQELAKQPVVPAIAKSSISQDDWDAMPVPERVAAIEFFLAEQADTTEGLRITFPRVKYPTSGAGVFEIPSAGGEPEYKPSITGVIVSKRPVRAWWPLDQPIANNPPECFSDDSVRPNPSSPKKQAELCDHCKNAQFGSGKSSVAGGEGRGQACKQRINVFLLRDVPPAKGTEDRSQLEDIPTLLSIPPSQLKAFSEFAVQLRKGQSSFLSQCTEFGLVDTKSREGTAYKGLALKMARKLTYSEMQAARQIADAFREQMESRGLVPEEAEDTRSDIDTAKNGVVIDGKAEHVVDERQVRIDPVTGEKIPF